MCPGFILAGTGRRQGEQAEHTLHRAGQTIQWSLCSQDCAALRIVLLSALPELAGAGLPALASTCHASPRNSCFCRGDLSAWRVQVFYFISLKRFKNLCLQG